MQITELLEAQRQAQLDGRNYAVLTLADTRGTTSRTQGKMLVFSDGSTLGTIGGGPGEYAAVQDALARMGTEQTVLQRYSQCYGELTVLLEVFAPAPLLVLCGGGNVSRCLMQHARLAGFRLWLLDPRPADTIAEAVALADRFIPVQTYEQGLAETEIPDGAYYVSASFSHETDFSAVAGILRKNFAYAGMLGSRKKVQMLFEKLRKQGFTDQQLAALHTPIGLDLGGQTPEELSVGILAQILLVKNGRSASEITPADRKTES